MYLNNSECTFQCCFTSTQRPYGLLGTWRRHTENCCFIYLLYSQWQMRCKPVFTTYSEGEPSPTNISSTTSGILRYISDSPDARTAGARQEPRVARDSDGGSNELVSTCIFCPSRLLVRRRLSNETPRHWRRWDIISPQTTLQPTASDNYAAAQLDLRLKDRWPRWSVRQVGLYSHTQARSLVLKAMSWSLKRVRTMCSDANTILYCTSSAHLYNLCLCFTFVLRWPYAVDGTLPFKN